MERKGRNKDSAMIWRKLKNKLFSARFFEGVISKIGIYIILVSISYVFLYPLLKMLSMSFMSTKDIINPEVSWIPQALTITNFKVAKHVLGAPKTLFNSIWFSATLALCQTAVSALTGYTFARFQFKLKSFWFSMILVSQTSQL